MEEKKVLQVTTRAGRKWLKQTVQDLPTDYHPLVHCADDLSVWNRNGEVESSEKIRVEQFERVEEEAENLEVEGISEEMLGDEEIALVEGEVLSDVEWRVNNEGIKVTQFTTPLLDLEALQDGTETATLVKQIREDESLKDWRNLADTGTAGFSWDSKVFSSEESWTT